MSIAVTCLLVGVSESEVGDMILLDHSKIEDGVTDHVQIVYEKIDDKNEVIVAQGNIANYLFIDDYLYSDNPHLLNYRGAFLAKSIYWTNENKYDGVSFYDDAEENLRPTVNQWDFNKFNEEYDEYLNNNDN